MRNTRILALDLALRTTGWVLYLPDSDTIEGWGTWTVGEYSHRPYSERQWLRASKLGLELSGVVGTRLPSVIAYEYPDYVRATWSGGSRGREKTSQYALGFAAGVVTGVIALTTIPLLAVSTSDAKAHFTGSKAATKARVAYGALARYPQLSKAGYDVTDAVAVALTAAARLGDAA